jgi:hypothetical protein
MNNIVYFNLLFVMVSAFLAGAFSSPAARIINGFAALVNFMIVMNFISKALAQ